MDDRPKFDNIYKGEWPYESSEGVGLKLSGIPTNIEKFIEIMQSESCNPVATRRILDALNNDGFKVTTVMRSLNFDYIAEELLKIGVILTIIPPVSFDKLNKQEIDNVALSLFLEKSPSLNTFSANELEEIKKRQSQFTDSFLQTPFSLGPYKR